MSDSAEFDYVIIGAGSAGSVLAKRLSEDPGTTVCVLEAGPADTNLYIHIPAGYTKTLFNPALTWSFDTAPIPGKGNRSMTVRVGKTLGGSSSINGMIYNRGQHGDYDAWAQHGNRGWGYDDILPYFRKSEKRLGPADEGYHGSDGPVTVTDPYFDDPLCEAYVEAAKELGYPEVQDFNGKAHDGAGPFQFTIDLSGRQSRRMSTARAFLHPSVKTGRVSVRPNSYATGILFEGKRATGVAYRAGSPQGEPRTVRARREVIVSAGALNTPRLLQISGVGDPDHLQTLGVQTVAALPGVGHNLMDHFNIRLAARVQNVRTINDTGQGLPLLWEIAKWAIGRRSILSMGPVPMRLYLRSDPALDQPNLHFAFIPASYTDNPDKLLADYPGMTFTGYKQRPESRGWVRAVSADIAVQPEVQPNYMSTPNDQNDILTVFATIRKLMRTRAYAKYFVEEMMPGKQVESEDEILEYIRANGTTAFHWSGTAKMGPATDPGAVVDDRLRVHGLQGLRVVDASVMPSITSGNTNAPTMMIAEKAADMIREDARAFA